MNRRREDRVKRRFPCEFVADGQRYRGIVVELSRSGLFVQTDATVSPGSPVDVEITGSGAVPNLRLRALVARRRMVPAPLATAVRRGIGLRIIEAPVEYGLACGSARLEEPIHVALESGGGGTGSDGGGAQAAPIEALAPIGSLEARPTALPDEALDIAGRRPEPRPRIARAEAEEQQVSRPEAVVVDDGELADIVALLAELGVETVRVGSSEARSLHPRPQPRRLFVTSARLALTMLQPDAAETARAVSIAVADDDSHTLSSMMQRLGFQYLVRRPVHADALRLLLQQTLFAGSNRRRSARLPFGCEVIWRSGLRRREGTLLELSEDGCRLLASTSLRRKSRIRVTIPARSADGRRLALRGRVVRRDRDPRASRPSHVALAVSFEGLSARSRERLTALLVRRASGPPMLRRYTPEERAALAATATPRVDAATQRADAATDRADAATQRADAATDRADAAAVGPSARADDRAPPDPAAESAGTGESGEASGTERRRNRRVRLDREVVALDPDGCRVVHALVGRDLSSEGLRVDPHPDLAVEQCVRIALYEPSCQEPLVLAAVVARDDGEAGLALRFVDAAPETLAEIERIVGELPAIEQLRPTPHRVVLGEFSLQTPVA
jgi:hypothetical protein